MKILALDNSVLNYYRKNVKGNSGISLQQAELKLTRNMHLAISSKARGKGNRVWYSYGNLRFLVVDGERVVWMQNQVATNKAWRLDVEKYNQLSEELGIESKHVKKTSKNLKLVIDGVPEVIVLEATQQLDVSPVKSKGLKGLSNKISSVFRKMF